MGLTTIDAAVAAPCVSIPVPDVLYVLRMGRVGVWVLEVWLEIAGAEDGPARIVVALEALLLGGANGVAKGMTEPTSEAFVGDAVVAVVG